MMKLLVTECQKTDHGAQCSSLYSITKGNTVFTECVLYESSSRFSFSLVFHLSFAQQHRVSRKAAEKGKKLQFFDGSNTCGQNFKFVPKFYQSQNLNWPPDDYRELSSNKPTM